MPGGVVWTPEQDDFIREHASLTIGQLAEATGHPWQSVRSRKRMILGSKRFPTMVKKTDEKYMRRWHAEIEG